MKILILKPSSLGDVVQALPVLRLIKRHAPASLVWWWVDANLAPLLEGDPDLAGVIRFERRGWTSPRRWVALARSLWWMREQQFDYAVDLQSLARSGVIAWLANGRQLIGLDEPREGARGFYDVIAPRASFQTHAVDWYLSVLPLLGVPVTREFEWLPARPAVAATVREKWNVDTSPWVAVLPGARWENKRWPAEHFAEVVHQLADHRADLRFAVLGGAADQPLGAVIARAAPTRCLDLTGATSLPEMVEWLRLCEMTVTNDTGPMHVAAALGKPVVALFGPTEPRRTGPYGQLAGVLRLELPCAPCLKSRCHHSVKMECLNAIPPARAIEAAKRHLASR